MTHVSRWIAIGLAVLMVPATAALGQTSGSLQGTVADSSRARLPGVTVEIVRNASDGKSIAHTTTDAEGAYRFTSLRPGEYVVRVELAGFSRVQRTVSMPGVYRRAT